VRELRPYVILERRDEFGVDSSHVVVERVDEEREREVALQLGCRARKDQISRGVRSCTELGEKPCLADARLADEQNGDRTPTVELGTDSIQRVEFLRAADEVAVLCAHSLPQHDRSRSPNSKLRVRDQGAALMNMRPGDGRLVA
jgi:hypothetical protein